MNSTNNVFKFFFRRLSLAHLCPISVDIGEVVRQEEEERASSSVHQVQEKLHPQVCPPHHHTLATQRPGHGSLCLHVHHHTPRTCEEIGQSALAKVGSWQT